MIIFSWLTQFFGGTVLGGKFFKNAISGILCAKLNAARVRSRINLLNLGENISLCRRTN